MLAAGTQIGPYRIHSLLGAGGMGEVYRATDSRIGRDVAVKILPRALAADAELLRRFEQEARSAGQLSHPNVLALYDVGLEDGTPYMVTELLEGETLRERLGAGPLPPRQVVEIAEQVAAGLAAAHNRGIVHRDLKPENLFVTGDGHVKILDFGIAKLTRMEGATAGEDTGTIPASLTATGAIIGTASYMAPEQIRGRPTDHRADLFALGAIVYELLTGRKAFEGETPADRMSAILTSEPPPLVPDLERAVPGLTLVIRRCLEKRPDARFDSARDLAFTLRVLLEAAQGGAPSAAPASQPASDIRFHRLTFREGAIHQARFAPDGETVVFGASWEGEPLELYMTRVGSPEARPLGMGSATLLSISPSGEMAVLLRPRDVGGFIELGVLARVPLIGGAPRELLPEVMEACWSPDGRSLAVTREVDGRLRLEYPIGKVLYQAFGWISRPCVSPDGRRVALLNHPVRGDNSGEVMEVDTEGRVRTITAGYQTVWALVYAPDGEELWFSGNRPGESATVFAVNRNGRVRALYPMPGFAAVDDISRSGRALLHHATSRMRMELRVRDEGDANEISWLEWSLVRDVSPDGKWVLFDETGPGGGEGHSVYLRSTSGGSAIRLGDGVATRFSPDGAWVMTFDRTQKGRILLLPVGVGESVTIDLPGQEVHWGVWIPRTDQLCIVTAPEGGLLQLSRYDPRSKRLEPIPGEGLRPVAPSMAPDGRTMLAMAASGRYALYPLDGSPPTPIDWIAPLERPIRFSQDGSHVFIFERNRLPCPVHRVEVATGKREPWFEIQPRQRSGVHSLNNVCASADGEVFAYSYTQQLAELHVVEGLR